MKALLWKEWRETRLLILVAPVASAIIVAVFFVAHLSRAMAVPPVDFRLVMDVTWVAIWPLSAVLVGAGMLANERERGTHAFLFSHPIGRVRLWTAKVLVHVPILGLTMLLSLGVSVSATLLVSANPRLEAKSDPVIFAFLTLGFYAGAALMSSVTSRVILAIGGGILVGLVQYGIMQALSWPMAFVGIPHQDLMCVGVLAGFAVVALWTSLRVLMRDEVGSRRGHARPLITATIIGLIALPTVVLAATYLCLVRPRTDVLYLQQVVPSPDGARIALVSGGNNPVLNWIWLVDSGTGQSEPLWRGFSMNWSPDGGRLAFVSNEGFAGFPRSDGSHRLWIGDWRARRRQEVQLPELPGYASQPWGLLCPPAGETAAVSGLYIPLDSEARRSGVRHFTMLFRFGEWNRPLGALDFRSSIKQWADNGTQLVHTDHSKGEVLMLSADGKHRVLPFSPLPDQGYAIASEAGPMVAAVSGSGKKDSELRQEWRIEVLNIRNGLKRSMSVNARYVRARLSPDGRWLAIGVPNAVTIYSVDSMSPRMGPLAIGSLHEADRGELAGEGVRYALAWRRDSQYLALASTRTLRILDPSAGRCVSETSLSWLSIPQSASRPYWWPQVWWLSEDKLLVQWADELWTLRTDGTERRCIFPPKRQRVVP